MKMSDEKIIEIIRSALERVRTGGMSDSSFVLMCNMLVNYQAPTEADMEWADGVVKRLGVGIPIVRGQKVIIRCAGDELRVRTVWDSDAQRVDICDEETFAILSAGGEADHEPLGFPRRFCFKYDEAIANEFEGKDGLGDEVWSRLKPWTEAVLDGDQATGAVGEALR